MELKDTFTLGVSFTGVVLAGIVAIKAVVEYIKQGRAKRSEIFLMMRTRLRADPEFKKICDLLDSDSPALRDVPWIEKDRFVGFFEELAILHNSGLLRTEIMLYMFGYFAIECKNSQHFWGDVSKEGNLWELFFDFAEEMERAKREFRFDRKRLVV